MKLSIAEGYYLIALDDEEGRLLSAAERHHEEAIVSAGLLELYLMKKISLEQGKVAVVDPIGTANGVLDKILNNIGDGGDFVDLMVSLKGKFKDMQADMDALLTQRGILKREETKLLWIPLSERMGNANYAFEQELRNALKSIVFKTSKPTAKYVILLSLIYDSKILDEVFTEKDDLIDAVKVAKDIINHPGLDKEISHVLKDLKSHFVS